MRYRWCEVCATLYLDGEVHDCVGPRKESNARPNWRDIADYPDPTFPKPAQWAWEFLRRNPSYRADWARYKRRVVLPLSLAAKKYGLDHMADPVRADLWFSLTWNVDRMHFISQHTKKSDYPASVAADELWLKFNLTWPIETNLKRAERALAEFRDPKLIVKKRKLEKRRDLYRTYLQLLDGAEAGATYDEMAAALYPDISNEYSSYKARQKVKDDLRAAKRLRDGDYLSLVLLDRQGGK